MPAMTPLLLKNEDGTTDSTLQPVRDVPFPHWRTNTDGYPTAGEERLEVQYETLKNGKVKVNVKLVKPILEVVPAGTVNSAGVQAAAQVADEDAISCTFFLSPRGTQSTRAQLMRHFVHVLSGASSTTATQVQPVSGTANAWKTSALPIPYAIINLLFPGS